MKGCRYLLIGLLLIIFPEAGGAATSADQRYVPREILVKFLPETSDARKSEVRLLLNATLISKIPSIDVEHWRLPESIPVEEAIERLNRMPEIDYAEPNYLYEPQSIPADPEFERQWYLSNEGQTVNRNSGTPNADISAVAAWDMQTGSPRTVIAVIDSGVAIDHPDIRNNIWVNPGEIPDNGIDDDANGYIDDIHGWDFVNDDNNPSDYSRDLYGDGHGTHVAGIIAAEGNNGIGITGVMWTARIMPLQVFDLFEASPLQGASIQSINIIEAVAYATDNGAKIINCSFGGSGYSNSQNNAFKRAGDRGCLVVAAAGNDRANNDLTPTYPASYPLKNMISVAATDINDNLAGYSNFGPGSVDLGAPGGNASASNIYSLTPPPRLILFSDDFEIERGAWTFEGAGNTWFIGNGFIQDSVENYGENQSSSIRTTNPVPAENSRGIHIRFEVVYQLEPPDEITGKAGDYLLVEISTDGNAFTPIYAITGFSAGTEGINLWSNDDIAGDFYLRFLLSTDESVNYGGVYIDNILITGIKWDFSGDPYGYKSGTSMATPVASGVAGLIWSAAPDLKPLDVKSILLGSVDPVENLAGKVLTGGRANAARALEITASGNIPPLPPSADEVPDPALVQSGADGDGDSGCFISALNPV